MSNKVAKITTVAVVKRQQSLPSSTNTTVVVRRVNKKKKKRNNNKIISSNIMSPAYCYAKCISDPFECVCPPLGFGTMAKTTTLTLYVRGSVACNATGGLYLGVIPAISIGGIATAGVLYNNSAALGVAGVTINPWANASNSVNMISTAGARVLSCALRAMPMIPGTAAPGVALATDIGGQTYNDINTNVLGNFVSYPNFHLGNTKYGESIAVSARPTDPRSYEFNPYVTGGLSAATLSPTWTVPTIVLQGCGNATVVWYEAVLHVEAFLNPNTGTFVDEGAQTSQIENMTNSFPSVDSLWTAARSILPDSTTFNSTWPNPGQLAAASSAVGALFTGTMYRRLTGRVGGQGMPRIHNGL